MQTRSTRSYFVATAIAVLALNGCAARERLELPAPIDLPSIDVPDIPVPEPIDLPSIDGPDVAIPDPIDVGAVDTNYRVSSQANEITSTSRTGVTLGVPPLETTTRRFYELFGELPPNISVVVIDTTNPLFSLPTETAAPSSRTITLVGGGLSETNAAVRNGCSKALTTLAAEAWVGAYANVRADALASEGLLTGHARLQNGGKGPGLPDWLHAAAIHLIADSSAAHESSLEMKKNLGRAVPLKELFNSQIPQRAEADLEDLLGATPEAGSSEAGSVQMAPTRRATMLFLAQATSVLEYLRVTRGVSVSAGLVMPLLAGWDMGDVLANEPNPTTLDALDTAWRRWVRTGSDGQ
jgi:ribosomal protein S9